MSFPAYLPALFSFKNARYYSYCWYTVQSFFILKLPKLAKFAYFSAFSIISSPILLIDIVGTAVIISGGTVTESSTIKMILNPPNFYLWDSRIVSVCFHCS